MSDLYLTTITILNKLLVRYSEASTSTWFFIASSVIDRDLNDLGLSSSTDLPLASRTLARDVLRSCRAFSEVGCLPLDATTTFLLRLTRLR